MRGALERDGVKKRGCVIREMTSGNWDGDRLMLWLMEKE